MIIWINDKKLSSFWLSVARKERMDLVLFFSPLYNQGTWDTDAIPVNTTKHKKTIHTCGKHMNPQQSSHKVQLRKNIPATQWVISL